VWRAKHSDVKINDIAQKTTPSHGRLPLRKPLGARPLNSSGSVSMAFLASPKPNRKIVIDTMTRTVKSGLAMRVGTKRKDGDPPPELQGCLPTDICEWFFHYNPFFPKNSCLLPLASCLPPTFAGLLHPQGQNMLARPFIQFILLVPITSTLSLNDTFVRIHR